MRDTRPLICRIWHLFSADNLSSPYSVLLLFFFSSTCQSCSAKLSQSLTPRGSHLTPNSASEGYLSPVSSAGGTCSFHLLILANAVTDKKTTAWSFTAHGLAMLSHTMWITAGLVVVVAVVRLLSLPHSHHRRGLHTGSNSRNPCQPRNHARQDSFTGHNRVEEEITQMGLSRDW